MANVYLVWSGSYSNAQVERVFSTRDKAEAWIGPGVSEYTIEEMEVDGEVTVRIMHIYVMVIDAESGTVLDQWSSGPHCRQKPTSFRAEASVDQMYRVNGGIGYMTGVYAESSISREHALKVAVEKRQEWLRTRDHVTLVRNS